MRYLSLRYAVLACCAILLGPTGGAHTGYRLRNVGISYGGMFMSGTTPRPLWELSYDRYSKHCRGQLPFWSVGLGTERPSADGPWYVIGRASYAPYKLPISPGLMTGLLISARAGVDLTGGAAFLRPEASLFLMGTRKPIMPRIAVSHGWRVMDAGMVNEGQATVPSGVLLVQVGVAVNFGVLRRWGPRPATPAE